ncbi:MAG: hypothetical protein WC635_12425 [Bacteriovorax sp.]|jgi:hypothetical protein
MSESDFLEWCIDNSFEHEELSSMTEKRLLTLRSSANFSSDKNIQIYYFKKLVEFNLMLKLFKYGLGIILIFLAFKFMF